MAVRLCVGGGWLGPQRVVDGGGGGLDVRPQRGRPGRRPHMRYIHAGYAIAGAGVVRAVVVAAVVVRLWVLCMLVSVSWAWEIRRCSR